MPVASNADHNVPLLPGRARYNLVNSTATWCYHHMAPGYTLTGEAPRTATTDEASTDPVVKGGNSEYLNLTAGGLFTIQAKAKKPLVIERIAKDTSVVIKIIDMIHGHERDAPACPFKISANEVIKATDGPAHTHVGILYRIDCEGVW